MPRIELSSKRHISFKPTIAFITSTLSLLVSLQSANAADIFEKCKPIEVMSFNNRVHILCDKAVSILSGTKSIRFFAIGTNGDAKFINRAVALSVAAQVNGTSLVILFNPADESGTAFGCQANDCRTILAIGLEQQ
jgi:hypothetical protein